MSMKTNFALSVVAFFACESSLAIDYEQYQQDRIDTMLQGLTQDMPQDVREQLENAIKPPEINDQAEAGNKLNKIIESEDLFVKNYSKFDVIGVSLGDDIKTLKNKLDDRFKTRDALKINGVKMGYQGFRCGGLLNDDFEQNILGDKELSLILKNNKTTACYAQRQEESEDGIRIPEKIYISLNPEGKAYEINYYSSLQIGKNEEECNQRIKDKTEDMASKFGAPFVQKPGQHTGYEIGWGFAYDRAEGNHTAKQRSEIERTAMGKALPRMDSDLRLLGSGYVATFRCRNSGKLDVNVTLFHRGLQEEGKVKPQIEKADF